MKKIWIWIIIGVILAASASAGYYFFAHKTMVQIEKPAVYLYPEQNMNIDVKLDINGKLTISDPDYKSGWNVFSTTEGIIDNKYDYLFYEADLKNIELPEEGWIVRYDNLERWFNVNLIKLGLNEKEKSQFMEYWMERLPETNYYEIKIYSDEFLKENMELIITPQPDTMIRLNFNFKPIKKTYEIKEPIIITPIREGFTVVEWGGVLDS